MRLGFLRTRVGRRFLATNLAVMTLLLAVIAVVAERYVRTTLRDESEGRIARLAKSLSLSTLSTLTTASRELDVETPHDSAGTYNSATLVAGIVRPLADGVPVGIDDRTPARALTSAERAHLRTGRPLLVVTVKGNETRVLLGRRTARGAADVVWARVNPGYLWGTADESIGGEEASFCVAEDQTGVLLHCSDDLPVAARELVARVSRRKEVDRAVIEDGGMLVASREVFLRYEFGAREWRVIVVQPTSISMSALTAFRRVILILALAALVLVFLVSHAQVRRTTEPLARLREGTERLHHGDFTAPVLVRSNDEFEEVAESFNGMARALDRQFALLHDLDAIDESALSLRERDALVREAVARLHHMVAGARVAVAVTNPAQPQVVDVIVIEPGAPVPRSSTRRLSTVEVAELFVAPRQFVVASGDAGRSYQGEEARPLEQPAIVLPLIQDRDLLGVVSLRVPEALLEETARWRDVRRMADRVALALRHVQLVQRLNALSAGTITAFARAIDANSPWTSGHSERVTRVAVQLGRQLQLPEHELDVLERGALLHDIGKIAVPASILDKGGKLSEAEWRVMRRHPVVGCEILGPIPALGDVLPLVRSHHERMDGTGYPDRLAGDDIPYLARVLAVADVFDALSSERPYRHGLSLTDACTVIEDAAGPHLDPRVVDAFLEMVRCGALPALPTRLDTSTLAASVAQVREGLLMHA